MICIDINQEIEDIIYERIKIMTLKKLLTKLDYEIIVGNEEIEIGNIAYEDSQVSRSTQYTGSVIGNQSYDETKSAETQYNSTFAKRTDTGNPPRTKYVNHSIGNIFRSATIANNT